MPFALEPLVAGELGEGTRLDATTHPPEIEAAEYVLDAPTEEDLIESFPVFLVSESIGDRLTDTQLRGFTLEETRVIPSREYVEVYGRSQEVPVVTVEVEQTRGLLA